MTCIIAGQRYLKRFRTRSCFSNAQAYQLNIQRPTSKLQIAESGKTKTKPQGLLQRFGEQLGHVFWPEIR